MKTMHKLPVLWALTALLAACGSTSTPTGTGNQAPGASIRLSDGSDLSTVSYLGPKEALQLGVSDADGTVTKVHWVIDAGQPSERSGDYNGADVKSKIAFVLPGLGSGSHTLAVTATDDGGATGGASTTFKVDAVAPTLSSVTVGGADVAEGQALTFSSSDSKTLKVAASDIRGGGDSSVSTPAVLVYVGDTLAKTGSAPLTYDLVPTSTVQTVRIFAVDSASNSSVVPLNSSLMRSFTIQTATTATAQEKNPLPVLSVVGNAPYTGNMSVNVSGNYDTAGKVDHMVLQITDSSGKVDNSTYSTTQSNAVFSVDTTQFANGNISLQLFAYTQSGLVGKSSIKTVQILNVNNPQLGIAAPSDGATITLPTVPVKVTLTRQGTDFTFDPTTLTVKLIDYRGQVLDIRTTSTATPLTCVASVDGATYTCNTSFDMAGLPADKYTLQATASATVSGATPAVQSLSATSTFTSNTSSVNPPASTIRFPIAITKADLSRAPALIDSSSGFLATVSDNSAVAYVEARVVGPYAVGNIETDGTKQCQSSGTPLGTPVDVLLLNVAGDSFKPTPYQNRDVFITNLDIDGSTYVPNSATGQRYDLRVTVADDEGNRNIQCVPIVIQRNAPRPTYTHTVTGTPDTTSSKPTYSSGTWTLGGLTNSSRVSAIIYAQGVKVSSTFQAAALGSVSVSQTTPSVGTYEVKWLVEDSTTGVVTTVDGGSLNVGTNP